MQMAEVSPRHRCTVVMGGSDDAVSQFEVVAGQSVLLEMIRRNIRAVPVGCRGGGCGVCRVRVLEGSYDSLRMSVKHISAADAADRIVLACRIIPTTDVVLELAPAAPGRIDDPSSGAVPAEDIPRMHIREHIPREHKE